MAASAFPTLLTFAFTGPGEELWGTGWFPLAHGSGLILIADGESAAAVVAELEDDDNTWHVRAPDVELTVAATGDPIPLSSAPEGAGFTQRATVRGTVTVAGRALEVNATGRRSAHATPDEVPKYDSIREVSGWFDGDEAVSLIALRPRKPKGHEQDIVAAAVIAPEQPLVIVDPRLSTTYDATGRPARVNLELWTDDPEQFPRRLAGEAAHRGAEASGAGWTLTAELMRCHTRGRDGSGVYLLARPV
jgi:hypothetical protein